MNPILETSGASGKDLQRMESEAGLSRRFPWERYIRCILLGLVVAAAGYMAWRPAALRFSQLMFLVSPSRGDSLAWKPGGDDAPSPHLAQKITTPSPAEWRPASTASGSWTLDRPMRGGVPAWRGARLAASPWQRVSGNPWNWQDDIQSRLRRRDDPQPAQLPPTTFRFRDDVRERDASDVTERVDSGGAAAAREIEAIPGVVAPEDGVDVPESLRIPSLEVPSPPRLPEPGESKPLQEANDDSTDAAESTPPPLPALPDPVTPSGSLTPLFPVSPVPAREDAPSQTISEPAPPPDESSAPLLETVIPPNPAPEQAAPGARAPESAGQDGATVAELRPTPDTPPAAIPSGTAIDPAPRTPAAEHTVAAPAVTAPPDPVSAPAAVTAHQEAGGDPRPLSAIPANSIIMSTPVATPVSPVHTEQSTAETSRPPADSQNDDLAPENADWKNREITAPISGAYLTIYPKLKFIGLCVPGQGYVRKYNQIAVPRDSGGEKVNAADGRTPYGKYFIAARDRSGAGPVLFLSWPSPEDAQRLGLDPAQTRLIEDAWIRQTLPPQDTPAGGGVTLTGFGGLLESTDGGFALEPPHMEEIFIALPDGAWVFIQE